MAALFGVHIGNSSACLAICKDDGRVEVVANDAGDRITPTILQWTTNGCTVGRTAELELFRNTSNTIVRNKHFINSLITEDELNYLKSHIPYKINKADAEIKYELLYDGKQCHVSPKEVAVWIFKKILGVARASVGENKDVNVVITVPLYYSQKSIEMVKDVARKAGFNILQVVDEASAAALGSNLELNPLEPYYYCLIYRVGGVSIDATILLVQDGMFSIIEFVHKYDLGGNLLTEKLAEYLAAEFKRQYKSADVSERGKYKLMSAAETAKQVLSIQSVVQCSCESIGNGYDFSCSISRARYENIIAPLIPKIIGPINEVLNKANINVNQIKKVVSCGGAMKTPKLQESLRKLLPYSEIINSSPDELIALGAAKQASYLTGYDHIPCTLAVDTPVLPASLYIKITRNENNETVHLIPGNSSVPLRRKFEEVADTGKSLLISLEDDRNQNLGTVSVNKLEHLSKAFIDLDISKDGKILLTVTNESSHEKTHVKCDLKEIAKTLN